MGYETDQLPLKYRKKTGKVNLLSIYRKERKHYFTNAPENLQNKIGKVEKPGAFQEMTEKLRRFLEGIGSDDAAGRGIF